MLKIKKDDEVVVISGRDKGKRGEVLRVLGDGRLLIGGVNMVKKHQRPNPNIGQQGGIVDQEAPIDASNVAICKLQSPPEASVPPSHAGFVENSREPSRNATACSWTGLPPFACA